MRARDEMRTLIQRAHAGQTRNAGKVDYWVHTQSVAEILEDALETTREADDDAALREDLFLAAQGHDLYEDTAVERADIAARFGARVDDLIRGMTNTDGDHDRGAYVEQMKRAPEEVRLIKYADLIDNLTSAAYGLHDLGHEWGRGFLLPIAREMLGALAGTPFERFPRTAAVLRERVRYAMRRFEQNLDKGTKAGG